MCVRANLHSTQTYVNFLNTCLGHRHFRVMQTVLSMILSMLLVRSSDFVWGSPVGTLGPLDGTLRPGDVMLGACDGGFFCVVLL